MGNQEQTTTEEAIEIRDDLEVAAGHIQSIINKLNLLIEGEINRDEYIEWLENNPELLNEPSSFL